MSKIIDGIAKDLKAIPETLKAKTAGVAVACIVGKQCFR